MRISRRLSIILTIALVLGLPSQIAPVQAQRNYDSKASLVVNSNGDEIDAAIGNGACMTVTGVCTLRAAIEEANALVGTDTISFSGDLTIQPATPLPPITDGVIVTAVDRNVTINKPAGSTATIGLYINSGTEVTRIHHLTISGFTTGIYVNGSNNFIGTKADGTNDDKEGNTLILNSGEGITVAGSNNMIGGNFIGINSAGTPNPNGTGVKVSGSANYIGTNGDGVGDGWEFNIISANTGMGIDVVSGGSGTIIAGNTIGLKSGAIAAAGNGLDGILVSGVNNVRIGTNGDGVSDGWEGNNIGANGLHGIRIDIGYGHKISGNIIGVGVNGVALGNGRSGIQLGPSVYDSTIGADENNPTYNTSERNIISGNLNSGIDLRGYLVRVAGNYIGTDPGGTADRGNTQSGVYIEGHDNTIGTDGDGNADQHEYNVISGNNLYGILIVGTTANNNILAGNIIGLNVSGTLALGNTLSGISLQNGPSGTHIGVGGTSTGDAAERNTISGNGSSGIAVTSAGSTTICGNNIGVDISGTSDFGNTVNGILIESGNNTSITIGVPDGGRSTLGNVISGNNQSGIRIEDADNHIIAGNLIGTNGGGDGAIPNEQYGILVNNSANIRIGTDGNGTTDNLEGNTISGNKFSGIELSNPGTINAVVAGNRIGTWHNGYLALPNNQYGIHLVGDPAGTRIGSNGDGVSDYYERNLVSGNSLYGIQVQSALATSITGNFIGTDIEGYYAVPNGQHGIAIQSTVTGVVTIGVPNGGVSAQGNLISGNGNDGICISGSSNHIVAGNWIGTNVDVDQMIPNGQNGVHILDASNIRIGMDGNGVTDAQEGNVIHGNVQAGVFIEGATSQNNRISRNSFYANGTLAIDLAPAGLTANDGMDLDSGSNGLQNHPVLRTAFFPSASQVRIQGDFNSTPSSYFSIQFYASLQADPSGFGEGEIFLTEFNLLTDAGGSASFDEIIPFNLGSAYQYFSAIAIAENFNTSEFGPAVEAVTFPIYLPTILR